MKLLTDDGRRRMTEPAYTISSPGAFGSGELKTHCIFDMKLTKFIKGMFNLIALRKAKIVYNFGLFECNRVKTTC